jgi:hypothetical protein
MPWASGPASSVTRTCKQRHPGSVMLLGDLIGHLPYLPSVPSGFGTCMKGEGNRAWTRRSRMRHHRVTVGNDGSRTGAIIGMGLLLVDSTPVNRAPLLGAGREF